MFSVIIADVKFLSLKKRLKTPTKSVKSICLQFHTSLKATEFQRLYQPTREQYAYLPRPWVTPQSLCVNILK